MGKEGHSIDRALTTDDVEGLTHTQGFCFPETISTCLACDIADNQLE